MKLPRLRLRRLRSALGRPVAWIDEATWVSGADAPVLEVTGWCLVARCADCLHVLRREPSPTPFGFSYVPYSVHLR